MKVGISLTTPGHAGRVPPGAPESIAARQAAGVSGPA